MSNYKRPYLKVFALICIVLIVVGLFEDFVLHAANRLQFDDGSFNWSTTYTDDQVNNFKHSAENQVIQYAENRNDYNYNVYSIVYRIGLSNGNTLGFRCVSFASSSDNFEDFALRFLYNSNNGTDVWSILYNKNLGTIYYTEWATTDLNNLKTPTNPVGTASNSSSFNSFYRYVGYTDCTYDIIYSDIDILQMGLTTSQANEYFNGNRDIVYEGRSQKVSYDGYTLKLKSYSAKYFDSDNLNNVYTDFKFELPDDMDKTGVYLDVDTNYKIVLQNNIGFLDVGLPDKTYSASQKSDFQIYPSGSTGGLGAGAGNNSYRSYVKDITPIKNYKSDLNWWNSLVVAKDQSDREILGKSNWFCMDLDGNSYKTSYSQVTYKVTVCKGNVRGKSYYFSFDLLGGQSAIFSTTPSDKGEETYNDDMTYTGTYNIKESIDSMGNPQNSYTYTPPDVVVNIDSNTGDPVTGGSSADGVINVMGTINVVGSVGSGDSDNVNVTIEDDDYTRDTLIETIKSGYGLLDNTDTGEKGDGLLALFTSLMGGINSDIPALFGFGISSVIGISILRSLFRR